LALTGAGARKVVYTTLAVIVEITEAQFPATNAIGRPLHVCSTC
jgi:hypothetical protein